VRYPALLATALVLAGCNGGTVDRHALTNDAATIDSITCEATLLADGIARNRVTTFFAREQAEELHLQLRNFANALSKRKTAPGLERHVRAKAKDAAQLAVTLNELHDHPTDRAGAAQIRQKLKQKGKCP
jgi:hypothetical protein